MPAIAPHVPSADMPHLPQSRPRSARLRSAPRWHDSEPADRTLPSTALVNVSPAELLAWRASREHHNEPAAAAAQRTWRLVASARRALAALTITSSKTTVQPPPMPTTAASPSTQACCAVAAPSAPASEPIDGSISDLATPQPGRRPPGVSMERFNELTIAATAEVNERNAKRDARAHAYQRAEIARREKYESGWAVDRRLAAWRRANPPEPPTRNKGVRNSNLRARAPTKK